MGDFQGSTELMSKGEQSFFLAGTSAVPDRTQDVKDMLKSTACRRHEAASFKTGMIVHLYFNVPACVVLGLTPKPCTNLWHHLARPSVGTFSFHLYKGLAESVMGRWTLVEYRASHCAQVEYGNH